MPGSSKFPIVFKGKGAWAQQFKKDLESEMSSFMSGVTLQETDPRSLGSSDDVVIVCPSYSRVEADMDHALEGIGDPRHREGKTIVLYIHNVTEHALCRLNTQQTVDTDLQKKYGGIIVIDIGVKANQLYACQHNKDSVQAVRDLLKKGWAKSLSSLNPFGKSDSKERSAPAVPQSTAGSSTSAENAAQSRTINNSLLQRPWRDIDWNIGRISDIKRDIQGARLPDWIRSASLLVLGQEGAGKKSFGCFIQGVFGTQLDDSIQEFWVVQNNLNKFRVVGTTGMLNVPITQLMQVAIPPAESQCAPANDDHEQANPLSGVIFVVNATTISSELDPVVAGHLKEIRDLGVPRIVIVTHTDEICREVKNDIRKMYHSTMVKTVAEKVGEVYGLPVSHVHAVKSYSKEEPNYVERDILLLRALQQIIHFSCDNLSK